MDELCLPPFEYKVKKQGGVLFIFDMIRKKYVVLTPEECLAMTEIPAFWWSARRLLWRLAARCLTRRSVTISCWLPRMWQ